MTSVSGHTFSALQLSRGCNAATHGIVTALLLSMNAKTNNAGIDLLALYAEVVAETAAAEKAADALEDKWLADYKAEKKAFNAMVRAAHAKGIY